MQQAIECQKAGDFRRAERIYRKLLSKNPADVNALHLLGLLYHAKGKHFEAVSLIRKAIGYHPTEPAMYTNLGVIFESRGMHTEAMACYRRAINVNPKAWEAHFNLGNVYSQFALHDDAVRHYQIASDLKPEMDNIVSNLIFQLDASGTSTAEQRFSARRRWNDQYAVPLHQHQQPHTNRPTPDRKLRVGYVSGDLRAHSAWLAISPIVLGHDRSQYDVVIYSSTKLEDGATDVIRNADVTWRGVSSMGDAETAALIRSDSIDILVDLSAFTAHNRLPVFAYKPAPIQVTAWGYAGGTGMDAMDYTFADHTCIPEDDRQFYAEEVVYLPSVICYNPPANAPEVGPLPARRRDGQITFGNFNRPTKMADRSLELWARVLTAVPNSKLILKYTGLEQTFAEARIRDTLENLGIATDRVRLYGWTPHDQHLGAYNDIDIQLDTVPQSGGITTLEAAWMGVPTVCMAGDRVSGRTSASFMQRCNASEFVGADPDGYVAAAVQAVSDLDRLESVRAGLRQALQDSVICDDTAYVREVEAAYRQMWTRWCEQRAAEVAA